MSDDIDSFIKDQKAKLAAERDDLDNVTSPRENVAAERKQWDKSVHKQNQATPKMRPSTPEHKGLPFGGYEEKRRKLQEERQKEYNEMISKKTVAGNSLRIDSRSKLRKQLEAERNREYNQMLKQQRTRTKVESSEISPEHTSLRFHSGSQRRKQLQVERNQEYKQLLSERQQPVRSKSPKEVGLPLGKYEEVRQGLDEERKQDYKEHVKKTPERKAPMFPDISPENTSLRFDSGSKRRRELSEERKKEYNKVLELQQLSPERTKEAPEKTGLPISDSGYQRYRAGLLKEKEHDYNTFQKCKGMEDTTESLPHVDLPITGSFVARRREVAKAEMNQEYNEFLERGGQPVECDSCPSPPHLGLDVGAYAGIRKRLEEQYQKEYKEFVKKKEEAEVKPKAASLEYVGLPLGEHEHTRKTLEQERNKEYQDHIQQTSLKEKKPNSTTAQQLSLPVTDSSYMNYRARIKDIKQKEYRDYLSKADSKESPSPEGEGLLLTNSSHHRRKASMEEQRNREYNEFLKKSPYVQPLPIPKYCGLGFTSYSQKYKELKRLKEERNREYNEKLLREKRGLTPGGYSTPTRPPTPQHVGLPLGSSEEKRKKLDEERKNEYNQFLSQKALNTRPSSRREPQTQHTASPRDNDPKKRQLEEQRQKEYNEYIKKSYPRREKTDPEMLTDRKENIPPRGGTPEVPLGAKLGSYEERRRRLQEERQKEYNQLKSEGRGRPNVDLDRRDENEDFGASLPGVRDHPSAERRSRSRGPSRMDRTEEEEMLFRQWLREREPRRGWATPTPTYEEILDKKRQEERSYRRHEEAEYHTPRGVLGGPNYMRSSISDGNLNKLDDDWKRFNDLDREYERKRSQVRRTPRDDPEVEFSQWKKSYAPRVRFDDEDFPRSKGYDRGPPLHQNDANSFSAPTRRHERSESGPNSIVPTGNGTRASADARKKASYGEELLRQMEADKRSRQREREEDMRGNPNFNTPGSNPRPSIRLQNNNGPPPAVQQRQAVPPPAPAAATTPYDDYSSQIPFNIRSPSSHQPGILEQGFGAALYGSPLEEAYRYYAERDPLVTAAPPPQHLPQQPAAPIPVVQQQSPLMPDTGRNTNRGQVRENNGLPFPTGDSQEKQNVRAKHQSYQEELKRQIEEQKRKKEQEKAAREAYERKKDEEIRNYDPFGKGGGGAPMRDKHGNIIANLRQMHNDNEKGVPTSSRIGNPAPLVEPTSFNSLSPRREDDSKTFARGGNGIFGEGKTDAQKTQQQRYQDELRQQMEERKRREAEEKRKQKEEEAREMKRLEEDRKKIQEELEAEKRKEEEKAKEAQRQQEELRQRQEEKRKEELRRQREADEKESREREEFRRKELEREQDRRRKQDTYDRPRSKRGSSPPVPAVRTKMQSEGPPQSPPIPTLMNKPPPAPAPNDEGYRTSSPAVPALRSKTEPNPGPRSGSALSRKDSATILNQLARMKVQLRNENDRVEKDLERAKNEQLNDDILGRMAFSSKILLYDDFKNEPSVYDPRLDNRGGNVDVFELNRPRAHRRPSAETKKDLKPRYSPSHKMVKSTYLKKPTDNLSFEAQQKALIQAQEDMLRRIQLDDYGGDLGVSRAGSVMSAAMLDSESAFIAVGNSQTELFPSSRSSSRATPRERRRDRIESPRVQDNPMGSVLSLDPDRLNAKNEARLKKLKSLAGDEISTGDPDDILERFMSKQKHSRPPSGRTLMDDTWMMSGTTVQ